jgi:hypothetical protein
MDKIEWCWPLLFKPLHMHHRFVNDDEMKQKFRHKNLLSALGESWS